MFSDVDCTLEDLPSAPSVRLGLRLIDKLSNVAAQRIVDARSDAPFDSAEDLARRAGLEQHEMKLLAAADALMSLAGHRRNQAWEASALRSTPALLRERLQQRNLLTAEDLKGVPDGRWVRYCGIVTLRQQPETASGTIFMSLEDETGSCRLSAGRACGRSSVPCF